MATCSSSEIAREGPKADRGLGFLPKLAICFTIDDLKLAPAHRFARANACDFVFP